MLYFVLMCICLSKYLPWFLLFTQSPSGGYIAGGAPGGCSGAAAAALPDKEGGGCAGADDASSGYGSPPDADVCDNAR